MYENLDRIDSLDALDVHTSDGNGEPELMLERERRIYIIENMTES